MLACQNATAELQYLFGLPAEAHGTLSAPQRQLATAMQGEWTSFAKSGVPAAPGAAPWPRFTARKQQMLSLIPPDPVSETDFSTEHHCGLWALGGD
jgi:para-nitrobenzyl esterase